MKYLISGVHPSEGGAGQVLNALVPVAHKFGFSVIIPKGQRYSKEESEALAGLKDCTIVLFHIQTIGFDVITRLGSESNDLRIYVLDSSFFCIRSYNYRGSLFQECIHCLGNPQSVPSSCTTFPIPVSKEYNTIFLCWLIENCGRFKFYAQNHAQAVLLARHFSAKAKIVVVGLKWVDNLGDRTIGSFDNISNASPGEYFDIVFHGASDPAKGFNYALSLARELPQFSFLFPFSTNHLDGRVLDDTPSNCTFAEMRWQSGLRQAVKDAKIILCPSLWSSPIEIALLKSIVTNGLVGVLDGIWRFCTEIPANALLRLSPDPHFAAIQIRDELGTPKIDRSLSQKWVQEYLDTVDFSSLFIDAN